MEDDSGDDEGDWLTEDNATRHDSTQFYVRSKESR